MWEFALSGQLSRRFTSLLGQCSDVLGDAGAALAQPSRARFIRRGVIVFALVWIVFSVTQVLWALLPVPPVTVPVDLVVLNPAESPPSAVQVQSVDLDKMLSWHLLGKAGEPSTLPVIEVINVEAREGIEDNARETRLDLKLRGIISSTADGLGHAIIEYKSKQQVYAVEDKLPISGRIILAKVMPDRVVIDNRGTYELLMLYEESVLVSQLAAPVAKLLPKLKGEDEDVDMRDDVRVTALARGYRQQLYKNPESLAELVRISAVRDGGVLRGYRIAPGSDAAQFSKLGFKQGDLVTAVNGIALNDPGNTVRLYQLMRGAREAVFDLERGEELLTVAVSLDDTNIEQ
ncbi:MAG: general secretion pathway protein C [Halioglobus sp.]